MSNKERLWDRYWRITERHGNGYAMPILWHLALRGDELAMTELGSTFPTGGASLTHLVRLALLTARFVEATEMARSI